jgi:hypothetical protein
VNAATITDDASQPALAPDQEWVTAYVDNAVGGFESDPRTSEPLPHSGPKEHDGSWFLRSDPDTLKSLRRLASDHPDLFFTAAAKHLGSDVESPAHRFLATLLLRQEKLFQCLTNPASCPFERALRIFRRLLAVDPALDSKLKGILPGPNDSTPGRLLGGEHATRAFEILARISPLGRLPSVADSLPDSADARIAAKAVLSVGSRMHPTWIAKQLVSENDRLRANAVEAAWGAKSAAAIRILQDCIGDKNNRVAGNALIGLYKAGCPGIREQALVMSASEEPGRRSTVAWAMGKMGSPSFIDRLTMLLRDENHQVRRTAIRSLLQIKRAESKRLDATAADTAEKAGTKVLEPVVLKPVVLKPVVPESVGDEPPAGPVGEETKGDQAQVNSQRALP